MKGKDDVVEEELFERTAKSMEGILPEKCYKQAKEEEYKVEVVGKMATQVLQRQWMHTIQKEKFTGVVDMLVEPTTTS